MLYMRRKPAEVLNHFTKESPEIRAINATTGIVEYDQTVNHTNAWRGCLGRLRTTQQRFELNVRVTAGESFE